MNACEEDAPLQLVAPCLLCLPGAAVQESCLSKGSEDLEYLAKASASNPAVEVEVLLKAHQNSGCLG